MRPAFFLDRDGVINRSIVRDGKPYPPITVGELEILPGVKQALEAIRRAGFRAIVVTNQPDVARGAVSQASVELINQELMKQLLIDDVYVCYHDDVDGCVCRKPKPGAILSAARTYNIDLSKSYMAGDRWKDIEAGIQSGCKTIFIDYNYDERRPAVYDYRSTSLLEAVLTILEKQDASVRTT
ncbi:MAG: HAD family hydrolase [Coxiellaceae bacterium]|nr:HAD family hydrolase [Coxiellaceae bacterium]